MKSFDISSSASQIMVSLELNEGSL